MKINFTLALIALLFYATASAQLNGSGKIISKSYGFQNFDSVELSDLNGKVIFEIGKTWSVKVDIDDNLFELLKLEQDNQMLKISLNNNQNNKLYVENTNIKIRIMMPAVVSISNNGNSDIGLNGLIGKNFRLKNTSNGNFTLKGKTQQLEIIKTGNGNIDAKNVIAETAEITASGNGDIYVHCSAAVNASISGNGDVTNFGIGQFSEKSSTNGNGKLR